MWRTDNKVNQPILSKVDLLSCLSTAMGLEHKPLLQNGKVNPATTQIWHPNVGLMASGQDPILTGDIASHPQLRRQHHQLAHVGWPAAYARSCTKNDFFQQKHASQCTPFTVRLTGQHQAVCNNITHTNSAGGLCPVTNRGHCDLYSHNPLCSQGEHGDHEELHSEEGSSHVILRWTGNLSREVVPEPT